jgi:hypothetical protein
MAERNEKTTCHFCLYMYYQVFSGQKNEAGVNYNSTNYTISSATRVDDEIASHTHILILDSVVYSETPLSPLNSPLSSISASGE